jgi:glycosyltransferase involved in cell wall biosynthesis
VTCSARRYRARLADASEPLHVCILSRKDLSLLTRVVRQAGVLSTAGWRVTVVCLQRPTQELLDTTPDVEYVEVEADPWTRKAVISVREWFGEKRLRYRHSFLRTLYRPFRYVFFVLLSAVLLRRDDERLSDKITELKGTWFVGVANQYLQLFRHRSASSAFAEEASKALQGRRIDICQAHDNYALLAARRVAEESGALLVYDAVEITEHRLATHHSALSKSVERLERREEAHIFRRAEAMITIGEALADWYEQRYDIPRPVVVRNCRHYWPYRRHEEIRRDCGIGEGERLVVWFGRAYPDQGLERTIETARRLREDIHVALVMLIMPAWKEFAERLREQARRLGIDGRVHFLPHRQPNELIAYVSGGDVGLIPRPTESPNTYFSMPNKFMEMVMARLPIAVSNLVEMRTLVERYDIGRVFDVRDPAGIATTLEAMLEPALHKLLRANVMRAAEELCWERESQKLLAVYDRLRPNVA